MIVDKSWKLIVIVDKSGIIVDKWENVVDKLWITFFKLWITPRVYTSEHYPIKGITTIFLFLIFEN